MIVDMDTSITNEADCAQQKETYEEIAKRLCISSRSFGGFMCKQAGKALKTHCFDYFEIIYKIIWFIK